MKKIYLANLKNCKFYLVLFCIFFSLVPNTNVFGQTFTTTGTNTWLCPGSVTSITVECWGGGGAGGGATGNPAAGGGGAGGAYTKSIIAVTPGTTYNLFVGTGGTGGLGAGPAGQSSWFNTSTTLLAVGGPGGAAAASGSANGGTAATTGNIGGTTNFYGGNGSNSGTSGRGGSGGGSAGTAADGNDATATAGGAAQTGGGAGAGGLTSGGNGTDASTVGGGGAGGKTTSSTDRTGGDGFKGKVVITINTYKASLSALSFGSTSWCAGETRNVTLRITNTGTAPWTSGAPPGVNFSYWWSNQSGQDANPRIQPFSNLVPGAFQDISIPITAPASGSLTLNFDLVKEGYCWFRDNSANCSGPGNALFTSSTITIVALPGAPTGAASQTFCTSATVANLAATGTTIKWYSASSSGTALATSTPLVTGTHYYASQTNASGCESTTRLDVTATVSTPAAPTGTSPQSFCAINNPTIANLIITATAPKWYTAATGGSLLVTTTPLVNGVTYYASQTISGCESATRLAVTATVGNPPAPTGTAAQSFCTINTPTVANLLATGTAIRWYSVATGGTALVSTTALVNATHYYASQTVSGCESALRFDVTATVGNPAAPGGTAAQSFCTINTPTVADLLATGTAIQWYPAATGGTALVSTTSLVNATHYYASQTVSGCESALRFDVTATVGNPAAPVGSAAQSFCAINTPAIADIVITATAAKWYTVSAGGTAIVTTTPLVNGTTYYASQTLSGCESATRLAVTTSIGNPAAPTGTGAQSFCAINTPTIADIVITATAAKWYTVSTGGTAIVTTTPLVNGTTYYASQTLSGCESATRLAVTTTVGDPAAPTGTASQLFCADANPTVADLSATGNVIQWYTTATGGTPLSGSTALVTSTHYYASQTLSGCESATRLDVIVTIYQPVIITADPGPVSQTVCATFPVTYTVTATGSGLTYQWLQNGIPVGNTANRTGTTTASLHLVQAQPGDAGDYSVIVSGSSPCASATSAIATLIVDQKIIFTAQPTATSTVCEGQPYTISASATGTVAIAEWKKNGSNYAPAVFDGVNTYSLTIPAVVAGDAASYQLVLDDGTGFGCALANSAIAVLIVNPTPVATITGTTTVCQSLSPAPLVTFTNPQALPVTITYNINSGTNVTINVNANTSATLAAPTAIAGSFNYNLVSVAYQSGPGCSNAITGTATVTVNPTPDVVATPSSQSICSAGAITNIVLTGSVPGTTFPWTRDNASVTGIATSGTGDISGSLINNTNAPITITFTITPTANGCIGTAITAAVIVNPTSSVNTVSNQTVCNNTATTAITFGSPTTGGAMVYNWTNDTPSIGLAASGAGNIASFTATNAGTAPVTATITVTPSYTNGATCPGTPTTFTITVNPLATVNTVSNQTVCKNTATTAVTFGSPTTGGTIVYNWTNNTPSIGLAASGAGNIASFTAINAGTAPVTATITVTPSYTNGATCSGTPITFTITVNPVATVNAVSNQTVCNNTATTAIAFGSPTTGGTIVYNWTNSSPSIGLAASGAGNIASFTATNTGTAPVVATITVTPSYTNGAICPGTPTTFTITVNPTATVTAVSNKTFCNNTATGAITFGSPTTGGAIVYNWTNNTPSIGLAASGAGNITSFTATNAGTAPVTATITVTPSYTNGATCPGTPITFTITVNPVATVNAVSNQTLCNNTATTAVTLNSPTTGGTIIYNWTNNTPSIGLAASGAGDIASFNAANAGTTPVTATITVTPSYTNGATCSGTPITFTITVNPTATVTAVSNKTFCNNTASGSINFGSPTTGGAIVYNWTNNTPSIGLAASGAGNIASFTATNAGTAPVTATITVTPSYTNGTTCPGTPSTFTITVNPVATVNTVSNQTVCKSTTTTAVTFGSATTGGTIVYNWTNNTPSIGLAASGAGNIASFTATNAGTAPVTATITVTPSYINGATCAGTPITFTITVNPAATVATVSNQTVCNNTGTAAINFSSPTTGGSIIYNWTNNAPSIGLAASGSGNIASFTATNAGTAPVIATITVTPSYTNGTSCNGTPLTFTITVNPTPNSIATPSSQIKCSGIAITTIVLSTSATPPASTTYTWTRDNTGTATGIPASGSGNISGTLTNSTAAPVTVTFTITPSFSGCVGPTTTATVLVNPKPTAGNITGTSTVCIGNTITLTPAGSGIGTLSYTWASSNTAVVTVTNLGVVTGVGAGTANITYTVTDVNGCTSATSASFPVTITKPTANAITGLASVCMNQTINLTANATGIPTLTYTWASSNNGIAPVSATGIVTGVAAGTANITYTVTDGNGCSATSANFPVSVVQIPTGSFLATENSGTPNNGIICAGSGVTFTLTPSGYGSYIFKVGGVTVQNGTSNVYSSSALTNGASVTVDVANSLNCGTTFGPIVITVIPAPTATLIADKTSICPGDNVTFTAGTVVTGNSYNFKLNGSAVQSGSSNTYSTTTLVTGNSVTVDVTNSNGCISTSSPVTIIVNPLPAGTLSSSGNTICAGGSITFTATAISGDTYNFKVDGISAQSGSANTYTTATLTNGNVITVDVTSASGCTATFGPPQSITVNPVPTGTLISTENSGTPNDGTICASSTVTFTATSGFANYKFYINGSSTPVQNGTSNVYINSTLSDNDVISVAVSSGAGCSATFNTVVITVIPAPSGTLSALPTAICVGDNVDFTATAGFVNYNFKLNGTSFQNGASNLASITTLANGDVVTVDVSNTATCTSTFNPVSVTVNPLPTGTLIPVETSGITNNDGTICTGATVVFTATPGFSNYNFKLNGVTIQNGTANTYSNSTLASGDVVSVEVTSASGCVASFTDVTLTVNPLPVIAAITGSANVCLNSQTTLSDLTPGGTWSSLNTGIATIDAAGIVTGVSAGTATINYAVTNTTTGCSNLVSTTITVNTPPTVSSITGNLNVCTGSSSQLNDGTASGIWGSSNTGVATVDPSTGLVNGIAPGTATISYSVTDANGCSTLVTAVVTVNNTPAVAAITTTAPSFNVCINSNINLADATTGGTWSSSDPSIATISSSGVVTGLANGTSIISYGIVASCGDIASASVSINVNSLPTGTVSGTTSVCQNSTSPDVTFMGTSGIAPFTFSYNINGGSTQTVTTTSGNSITIPAPTAVAGTFTYNLLTVGDANGCSQVQTGAAAVTINASPTATISGTVSVCQNLPSPNITFTGANGTAPYIFTYNINGGTNLTITSVGTIATIPVSTLITGVYTYTLVSVQDASVTLCSGIQTGSATVTVTLASVGGSVGTNATVCSGTNTGTLTLSGQTGNVVRWENSIDGGTTWSSIANATSTLTYTNITISTMYRAVVMSGTCSSANSSAATISVTPVSAGGTVATSASVCSGTNGGTLTLSGYTGSIVRWESSIDGGTTWVTIANTSTSQTYSNLAQTTMYRAVVQNSPCSTANSLAATITVNPLPTATISGTVSVCQGIASPNITFTGAGGTAPYTFTYKINSGSNLTVVSSGNIATVGAPTTTAGTYVYTLISVKDATPTACIQNSGGTATVTVNAPPAALLITPSSASFCLGSIQSLTATANVSTTGSVTVSSGTINLAIPDVYLGFFPGSVTTNVTVSTVPAGAVITSMSVNFNITHTYDNDLILNVRAPNGKVLNLVDQKGNNGDNFTNTIVSSAGINPFTNVASAAPFTGTFAPDADNNVGTPNSGNNTFASLYSIPNGTWTFGAEDDGGGDVGKILDWSITINYTIPNAPLPVIWSPVTDLFTDPGATTAYTGTALSTVYAKPATSGTKTYMATASNGAGCTTSQNVTLTVNPIPVVTITADYCAVAGKVQLTASSTPAASSYLWSTGETTQTILVDVAGIYSVTAFSASLCPGKGTISIANELVTNGNFEGGDVGFTTLYTPHTGNFYNGANTSGLYPEGDYAVDTSAYSGYNDFASHLPVGYHPNFHGKDHTTGHGKFMMINGSAALRTIWQETANVLPNTTYYFSAWGMNLNPGSPAMLQFAVNGIQTGSIDSLIFAPMPAAESAVSTTNWRRFYGTWTSGPTITSAVISIVNLNLIAGGNDFGLDDISFSTLSTFIQLQSAPGTDAQSPCINTPITNIVYSVGSSAAAPTVTGLPPGVTASFNGVLVTVSGTPIVAGNYSYTITTTGSCQPSSASGTINVQGQKITLTSGSASPTVCINTAITSIVYTVSGSATGADVTGLPAGLTSAYNAGTKTFTISGTPTVSGIFKDTVITTGTCKADTAFGTITVQNQTIVLSSGSDAQTICVNTAISGIIYTVGGSATGAGVTGLPAGITGFFSGGSYILSGTATAPGTFNYTITTTGTCAPGATATGTITVNPAAAITLSSAAGTDNLATCINAPMTNVTYAISGGGTNATITSGVLPAGVTGGFSGGVFTISGTPTAAGTFNYTISTTGTCAQTTISGTITVQSQTIVLTSGTASPTLCLGSTLTNIVFTAGGTATGATLSGTLPTGVTGSLSGATYTISGSPTQLGTFNYTVTTTGGCSPAASVTGAIIVNNGSVGGALPALVSICSGATGNLNLAGNTGNVVRWEQSVDNGATWTNITNTTTTLSYSGLTVPTQYRALVKSGSCTGVYSSVVLVAIHNLWTGLTNTDWNTASNWSDNQLPSVSPCPDVLIPGGTPNQPTLTGTSTIANIHIFAGATVTINGGTLQIAGTIINGGTFIAANGTVELNGSTPQTIPASTFQNNALNNLIISNTNATGVTLGGALDIYGALTYSINGKNLNTNDVLTLKSTATRTASIGNMTNHTINGEVTVERYIATGTNHAKSWQLLAIPTTGQTIKQSWQEGATVALNIINGNTPATNPNPGYGTMLTSDVAGAETQSTPGFDAFTSPGPSIKVYNTLTDGYNGPASTALPIYNQKGYFILVRGDRSVYTSGGLAVPTVLRTKGILFTPANLPPSTTVLAGKSESVGNPYASAIDLRKLSMDANVNTTIIVWDPTLGIGSAYGLGAYQTLYLNGDGTNNGTNNYINLLTSTAYGTAGTINNNIQSGQAFIIQGLPIPAPNGTISFTESSKANGSKLLFRPQAPADEKNVQLRANLYGVNAGNTFLADGTLIQYNDTYSDSIDGLDAHKMGNTAENLGIKTAGILLAIERRHTITQQDTIFLNLTGVRVQAYHFEFIASNLNTGLRGYLEDNYLQTRTPLSINGTTTADFTIENIAGSYAHDRFRIVFAPPVVLPVTVTVNAYRQDKNINVEWKVENEMNIKQYEVEKSTNGTQFTTLTVKPASANNGLSAIYFTADVKPVEGDNYYRVKSVDINGKTAYSNVVKVLVGSMKQDITIYPNPITDGMIHLQLMNQPEGKYGIRLLNKVGQVIVSKRINHTEGSSTELIKWDFNLAHGMYQLEVTRPDGSVKDINVLY